MGDRIRKWIAVLLAGSILAMIQLVPAGGAVFVRENIENKGSMSIVGVGFVKIPPYY